MKDPTNLNLQKSDAMDFIPARLSQKKIKTGKPIKVPLTIQRK